MAAYGKSHGTPSEGHGTSRGFKGLVLNWAGATSVQQPRYGPARPAGAAYDSPISVDVTTEIELNRPRADVASFASDPDNATVWYENIRAVEWRSRRPVAVGSRLAFVARFLGRRLAYTYEVKEMVAGERFVMSTTEGPFPMETTYTWHDTPSGGTRMTLRNRGEPSGFPRLASPLMAKAMRRANRKDLRRLKSLLEAPANAQTTVDTGSP